MGVIWYTLWYSSTTIQPVKEANTCNKHFAHNCCKGLCCKCSLQIAATPQERQRGRAWSADAALCLHAFEHNCNSQLYTTVQLMPQVQVPPGAMRATCEHKHAHDMLHTLCSLWCPLPSSGIPAPIGCPIKQAWTDNSRLQRRQPSDAAAGQTAIAIGPQHCHRPAWLDQGLLQAHPSYQILKVRLHSNCHRLQACCSTAAWLHQRLLQAYPRHQNLQVRLHSNCNKLQACPALPLGGSAATRLCTVT